MAYPLRQSTATQYRTLGPIVDNTNYEAYTTTIPNTEIKLTKYGTTVAVSKNSGGSTPVTNAPGQHSITFDATDTNTVGELNLALTTAAIAPYAECFYVLEEAVYDALYPSGAAGYLPAVPTGAIPSLGIVDAGTMQAGSTSTTAKLKAVMSIPANLLNNGVSIYVYGGTGAPQTRDVISWAGDPTDVATISPAWATTPDATSTYILYTKPPAVTDSTALPLVRALNDSGNPLATAAQVNALPTSTVIAGAVWNEATATHVTSGTFGAQAKTSIDAIKTKTDFLPADTNVTLTGIASKTVNLPANPAAISDIPPAAVIADAVWDEVVGGHVGPGAAGAALVAAGSSGDPWTTVLPGAYGDGTAGFIVGNRLDVAMSSRLATVNYAAAPSGASILSTFKGDSEWKLIVANVNGDWTTTYSATNPGQGTLTLKDVTGVTTLATYTLHFDSAGRITQRAVA